MLVICFLLKTHIAQRMAVEAVILHQSGHCLQDLKMSSQLHEKVSQRHQLTIPILRLPKLLIRN